MSEITPNTPNPVREDAYVEELSEKLGIDPQYIPKSPVWRNEEEIKAIAEMFANMSGGSGGGVLVAHDVEGTLDKTWQEIHDADFAVLKLNDGEVLASQGTYSDEGEYGAQFWSFGLASPHLYTADNPNGYPSYTE